MPKFLDTPVWYDANGNETKGYDKGESGKVLVGNGSSKPEWKNENALRVTYANNAGSASNATNANDSNCLGGYAANQYVRFDQYVVFPAGFIAIMHGSSAPETTGWTDVSDEFQGKIPDGYTAWRKGAASEKVISYQNSAGDVVDWASPSRDYVPINQTTFSKQCTLHSVPFTDTLYVIFTSNQNIKINGQTKCAKWAVNAAETINMTNLPTQNIIINTSLFSDTNNIYLASVSDGGIVLGDEWQQDWSGLTVTDYSGSVCPFGTYRDEYDGTWHVVWPNSVNAGVYLLHLYTEEEEVPLSKDIIIRLTS